MMLHGLCVGEEAGAVIPCKVAAASDERYLVCAANAAWTLSRVIGSPLVFCNVWMQIAL